MDARTLVERPGVPHVSDGHRGASVRGDEGGRRAVRQVIGGAVRAADHPARAAIAPPATAADPGELPTPPTRPDPATMEVHVWDDSGTLRAALSASGLRCVPAHGPEHIARIDPARGVLAVAAAGRRALRRLRAANIACLRHGVSWLPVGGYDGAVVHVGPLMIPGQTACAECLLRRLAANLEGAGVYHEPTAATFAPTPTTLRDWSYSMAALILLRWVSGRDAALPGLLLTLAPDDLAIHQARVYRVPRCPGCAGPDHVLDPAPWDIIRQMT
jgi:bacteriocin biosynthesis cyclodehydratase domain-containing protein